MKRKITILIVLLANLIFLAHTVIPHHHHHAELCFASSHSNTETSAHQHDDCCPHEEKQEIPSDRCCVLQDAAAIPADQVKASPKISIEPYSAPGGLWAIEQVEIKQNLLFAGFIRSYTPSEVSLYSQYILRSIGLRAPPAI